MHKHIFLDTSFLIRLMNADDDDHAVTRRYFELFLGRSDSIQVSTIVAAEYGVGAPLQDLPLALDKIRVVPFNLDHASKAAEFARATFAARRKGAVSVTKRVVIPNDTKILAQAQVEAVDLFIGRDDNCEAVHKFLTGEKLISYPYHDLRTPVHVFIGTLDL